MKIKRKGYNTVNIDILIQSPVLLYDKALAAICFKTILQAMTTAAAMLRHELQYGLGSPKSSTRARLDPSACYLVLERAVLFFLQDASCLTELAKC